MRVAKSKIPLIFLQKTRLWKNKSNKSEDLTIFKDEILKNIQEIQGFIQIYWGFKCNIQIGNPDQRNKSKNWIPISNQMYNVTWMK